MLESRLVGRIERRVRAGADPKPRSGKQELLENIVNRYV